MRRERSSESTRSSSPGLAAYSLPPSLPPPPSSTLTRGGSKRVKVKELSYSSVVGKGGGLVRVYTALVSPFLHRVVVVCGRKTTVSDVVQVALAKCGKQDRDPKK